jgi:hypothetical protein
MRLRWLALFPLAFALIFVAVVRSLGSEDAVASFVVGQKLLVRVLALVGCVMAASAFDRGDHLRRAWTWMAWSTAPLLLRDLLRLGPLRDSTSAGAWLLDGFALIGNLALVIGVWQLARSWRMAAMTQPGTWKKALALTLGVAVLALIVAAPAAVTAFRDLLGGNGRASVNLVSALADIVSLCLIGPLLLTAIELRGGLFSWPWGLITACRVSWLFYDAAAALELTVTPGAPLHEIFRGLALNLLFAAGVAQAMVVRAVRRAAA